MISLLACTFLEPSGLLKADGANRTLSGVLRAQVVVDGEYGAAGTDTTISLYMLELDAPFVMSVPGAVGEGLDRVGAPGGIAPVDRVELMPPADTDLYRCVDQHVVAHGNFWGPHDVPWPAWAVLEEAELLSCTELEAPPAIEVEAGPITLKGTLQVSWKWKDPLRVTQDDKRRLRLEFVASGPLRFNGAEFPRPELKARDRRLVQTERACTGQEVELQGEMKEDPTGKPLFADVTVRTLCAHPQLFRGVNRPPLPVDQAWIDRTAAAQE